MGKNEKIRNIDLRSDDVQELMGKIPPKILRIGISVILLVLIAFFAGSYFIKYPSCKTFPVKLNSDGYIQEVLMPIDGMLIYAITAPKSHVKRGDTLIIAVYESDTAIVRSTLTGMAMPYDFFVEGESIPQGTPLYSITSNGMKEMRGRCYVDKVTKNHLKLGMNVQGMAEDIKLQGYINRIADVWNASKMGYAIELVFDMPPQDWNRIIDKESFIAEFRIEDRTIFDLFFRKNLQRTAKDLY